MSLTPVRIRGKRKSPSSTVPLLAMSNQLSLKKKKRSLASVRASRSSNARPTLQSLPAELLESVLLYSKNLAFPRSSHLIGAKLSGKATLLRLFILVFHDTWDQWFGISKLQLQGSQTKREHLFDCEGDIAFQSAMLELPWVDIDFLLQAQQTWADKHGRDRRYQHSVPSAEGVIELNHDHEGGFTHFNARACFDADYGRALEWPAFHTASLTWGTQDVHPLVQIPVHLITGPWDEEKRRRIFWLIRGGLHLGAPGQTPISWEVKISCLENAVISADEPNSLIVNCLIGDWIFTDLPEDVVRKQLVNLTRRIEWGGDSPESREILRRVAYMLNLDLQLPQYRRIPG